MKKDFSSLYSKNYSNIKSSEINELLKLLDKPSVINFASGLPAQEVFPIDKLKSIVEKVMESHAKTAFQYSSMEGINKLRLLIVRIMKNFYNINLNINNIIITNGSQQGLSLMSKILLDPEDIVLTTAPAYLGAISCFNSLQSKIETVPQDQFGIKIDCLQEKLIRLESIKKLPKLVYLTPNYQNPTGVTIPRERREQIYELLCKYDLLLIEDDSYGFLRYGGPREPSIKSYDVENRVLYLGSFSKIFAPGFRIGWVAGSADIINKCSQAKQIDDLCSNTFGQYCVSEAINHNILFPYIKEINKFYKKKRDIILKSISKYFPKQVSFYKPDGGFFIWVILPEGLNAVDLLPKAIENNVSYAIGSQFFPNENGNNTFRLNFGVVPEEKIEEGIKKLAQIIKHEIKKMDKRLKVNKIEIF